LINFNEMHDHNDKNITITLKAQPNEIQQQLAGSIS
jgi:hypothetical protein